MRMGGVDIVRHRRPPPHHTIAPLHVLGYVSQFLRVVPRVPTLDVVAEPLLATSALRAQTKRSPPPIGAADPAEHPSSGSGRLVPHDLLGRRAAARQHRARLCPSPTRRCCWMNRPPASIAANRARRSSPMIDRRQGARGAAIIGIFHDHAAREAICDRQLDVTQYTPGLAA